MGLAPGWGRVTVLGMAAGKAEATAGRRLLTAWGESPGAPPERAQHLTVMPPQQCPLENGPGRRSMVGPAAEPCQAVPLAKPCLPKPPELHDLELAKWHLMMCSTAGWSEEAARGRCLPRSGHGGWMPHFSLVAQPSLQAVEGTEKHPATSEE